MNKTVLREAQLATLRSHVFSNFNEFRQYTNAIYFAILWARK